MTDPERIETQEQVGALVAAPPAPIAPAPPPAQMSVADVIAQALLVQEVMRAVMKEGTHYGIIPGTGDKPVLFKPGAEKLCLVFRMDPEYQVESKTEQAEAPWHVGYVMRCTLYHQPTGMRLGSGMGSATTREPKWGETNAKLRCPTCGKPAVIKGKAEYGGGYICFKKQGGCGAKFGDSAPSITAQVVGKVERENVAEVHNTVLKMACKRALVAAVLNTTAASDIFTQDLEDLSAALSEEEGGPAAPPKKKSKADDDFAGKVAGGQTAFDAAEANLGRPLTEEDERRAEAEAAADEANRAASAARKITPGKLKAFWAKARGAGLTDDYVREHLEGMGLASSKDIQEGQFQGLLDWVATVAEGPPEERAKADGWDRVTQNRPPEAAPSGATAGPRQDH